MCRITKTVMLVGWGFATAPLNMFLDFTAEERNWMSGQFNRSWSTIKEINASTREHQARLRAR